MLVEQLIEKLPEMEYIVAEGRPYTKTYRGIFSVSPESEQTRMVLFIANDIDRARLVLGTVTIVSNRETRRPLKAFVLIDGQPIMLQDDNLKAVSSNMEIEHRRRIEKNTALRKKDTDNQCGAALAALGSTWDECYDGDADYIQCSMCDTNTVRGQQCGICGHKELRHKR